MEKLGRFVRWYFGLQALLVLAIPVEIYLIVRVIERIHLLPPGTAIANHTLHAPPRWFVALVVIVFSGGLSIVSGVAWWALKKGWPSARVWALIGSVIMLPLAGFHTLVGIAGLVAFWHKETAPALADAATPAGAPHRNAPGDGTYRYVDLIAPVLMVVIWIAARVQWAVWGSHHGLPLSALPKSLSLLAVILLAVVFHEAGHFLAGWGSDMVLRAFQLGPLSGQIRSGRWQFGFEPMGLIGGGSVSMVPKHLKHIRGRLLLVTLAGPIASLLTGSIATVLALAAPGSRWQFAWGFLALLGTIGFCDFLFNLTPLRPEGAYSDGAQIFHLMSAGPWAVRHLAMAMAGSSLATSLRPRDFDAAILEQAANQAPHGADGLTFRMLLAMHHLDSGRNDEGIAAWRQGLEQDPHATEQISADSAAELAFYEAAIAGDLERARHWWERVERKGDSKKEIDYWKGRTAVYLAEGKLDEAAQAFHQTDEVAQKLPEAGAYEYDRWCVDVLRRKLNATDLARLSRAVSESAVPEPALSV